MNRIARILPVGVFFALAVTPTALFGIAGPWPGSAPAEFAPPRPFPPNLVANTFRRIGDWFSDRMGLRAPMVALGSAIANGVWQTRVRGDAIFGNPGWLFYNDDEGHGAARMVDVRGRLRLPDDAAAQIDATLREADTRYAACGKHVFVFVAPNKQSIYPEELSARFAAYPPTRFDGLLEKLSPQARALVIDPRARLRAAKNSDPWPVYFRTDTHWNASGANHAYRLIVERLAQANAIHAPEFDAWKDYEVSAEPFDGGDIARRMLNLPWRLGDLRPILTLKAAPRSGEYTERPGAATYVNPEGRSHLLMYGDSFAQILAYMLAHHFAKVTVLLEPPVLDGALARSLNADVTLLEVVERQLPRLARPPRNLDQACGP